VAINLAISIAQHAEKSALLVDFDLRHPSVANYLGLDLEISLTDMLEGKCELSDILVNPGIPRLVVMAAHRPLANSAEILASSRVQRLIKEIRERYEERIVIFDLPPLLNADDAMAVLPQIDCVLMVVANGMSSNREIEDSLRQLPATNLLGTVLNKVQGGSQSYDYYY
jgi:protein-tyrosine kinase